ncbi:MAG TPA: glycosyltransferase family 87 protein [Acidobacteriaceae bacterium]
MLQLLPFRTSSPHLNKRRGLALALLLLSLAFFIVRGYENEYSVLRSIDFKQPYASARCLLKGCDPYSESQTHQAYSEAHGTDDEGVFVPYSALYPPFSLAVLAPLAALPYGAAHTIWDGMIAGLFSFAVLLVADLCLALGATVPIVVLAAFAADSTILLMEGQVSGIVISLLVIGFWCLLRQRFFWVAVTCLSLALLLKPHDAALPVLYLLFAGARWRKAFFLIAGSFAVFALVTSLWCASRPASRHWEPELAANVAGNETAGNANDPTRGHVEAMQVTNLQALVGAFDTRPAVDNALAGLLSVVLLLAWACPALRMPQGLEKHLLALAAMASMTLLPVYHRQYDTRLLVLAFPAVALLWRRHGRWGVAAVLLMCGATYSCAHQTLHRLAQGHAAAILQAGPLRTLCFRPLPETALLLTLFFLAAFYREWLRPFEAAVGPIRTTPLPLSGHHVSGPGASKPALAYLHSGEAS